MHRLTYVLPTVYLVAVFTVFQVINIESVRNDAEAPAVFGPRCAYILTLPWSVMGATLTGPMIYLPMLIGALLNAAIAYVLLRRWFKK